LKEDGRKMEATTDEVSAEAALIQSQQLIDAMDEDFAFRNEVSLSQSILTRNRDLMVKIDALKAKGDKLSEEESVHKKSYLLELHSNMQGMSRLIKEMGTAASAASESGSS
jgi:hypothetical protein